MQDIEDPQDENTYINHIKAKSRAKLAWIIPASGLLLFPMLKALSLYTGLLLGLAFLFIAYRDAKEFGKEGIWSHLLAGAFVIGSQIILVLIAIFFLEDLPLFAAASRGS